MDRGVEYVQSPNLDGENVVDPLLRSEGCHGWYDLFFWQNPAACGRMLTFPPLETTADLWIKVDSKL
jgi:hypothetical protein